jgi:SAM-dependent methyltransferase
VELIEHYNENAEEFYRDTIDLDMDELYAPFLSLIPKGGRILDAGSGSGRDSLYFIHKGYDVTAIDASQALVTLSSRSLGDRVHHLSFQQLEFENEFDAAWACASLLHVPRKEMDDVINRIVKSLKPIGFIYASFKYGDKEEIHNNRFFNYYDEASFDQLLRQHTLLSLIRSWKSADVRESRRSEYWFNALLKKIH